MKKATQKAPVSSGETAARKRPVPPVEHQWKQGQSGNPNGRPRKFETILRNAVLAKLAEPKRSKGGDIATIAEIIAGAITLEAAGGKQKVQAFKAIADLVEPKSIKFIDESREALIAELQRRGIAISATTGDAGADTAADATDLG